MVKNNVFSLTAGGTIGPNNVDIEAATGNASTIAELDTATLTPYINGLLHGIYTIAADGSISGATPATNGKWVDLQYDGGSDTWFEP